LAAVLPRSPIRHNASLENVAFARAKSISGIDFKGVICGSQEIARPRAITADVRFSLEVINTEPATLLLGRRKPPGKKITAPVSGASAGIATRICVSFFDFEGNYLIPACVMFKMN
jgi:hypothetical protein